MLYQSSFLDTVRASELNSEIYKADLSDHPPISRRRFGDILNYENLLNEGILKYYGT